MAIDEQMTTVVIAGHCGIFRAGVELVLEAEPDIHVTGVAETCEDTARLVRMRQPAVVVADLEDCSVPDEYGHALRVVRGSCPATAMVAIVGTADPIVARDVLQAGAAACLTSIARPEVLVDAVHRAAAGETYLEASVASALANLVTHGGNGDLTEREVEILRLVAKGHTNREIAERLYLSVRTVESHRARVRQKLGTDSRSELVMAAQERGLYV